MPENLRVEPAYLLMSADHLDMREAEHTEAHRVANADIEAATSGWVGSSATSLHEKITHLRNVTEHIGGELEFHRDAFRQVGNQYDSVDESAATGIIRVRQSL